MWRHSGAPVKKRWQRPTRGWLRHAKIKWPCTTTAEAKRAEEAITTAKRRETFLASGHAAVFGHYHAWEPKWSGPSSSRRSGSRPCSRQSCRRWSAPLSQPIRCSLPRHGSISPTPGTKIRPRRSARCASAQLVDHRHGRVRLIDPITREQAEERHHNFEYYVLATRLSEGQLLILT